MKSLLICVLAMACASGNKEAPAPAPAATVVAGSLPSNAPATENRAAPPVAAATTPAAAPPVAASPAPTASPGGAMTAAEAAAALSKQDHGGAGDAPAGGGDSACASDDDCTFSRLAPGACCAMLCNPRAVTKKESAALDAHAQGCPMSHECPQPSCAPPRQTTYPACEKNRCVTRVRDPRGAP